MTDATVALGDARSYRLTNIDMLRGLVIIIMALDHTRDYFHLIVDFDRSLDDPNVGLGFYLTRWITNFCAPVFIFFAGTSVGLMADRWERKKLAAFVLKRGIWLIFCEVVIVSTGWTFGPFTGVPLLGGNSFIFIQVIFAIGAAMVALSGLLFLGPKVCLSLGFLIIFGQNMLDEIWPMKMIGDTSGPWWGMLYSFATFSIPPFQIAVFYPILPWVGVILLGYGSSYIFKKEPRERDAFLIKSGLVIITLFLVLRFSQLYGEPNLWQSQERGVLSTIFDFMSVTKYPPSLLFLLATLGPMAIVCGLADRVSGWIKDTLVVFGRVPFFFYIAHIYVLHLLSVIFGVYQGFETNELMTHFFFYPLGYGTSLIGVYVIWIVVVAAHYPACKWMANLKKNRKDWWLSYL